MRSVIACLCLLGLPLPVVADDALKPTLGDHLFTPVTSVPEPFITTYVQISANLGSVRASVPLSLLDSTFVGKVDANQVLVGLGVGYQHAVNDWLAAGLNLGVVGRVGTSTTTILTEGLTGSLQYDLGWLLRLYQSRTVLLSGSMRLGNSSATIINVKQWAAGIESGDSIPLARSHPSVRGSGGLRVGWGMSRRFGLLGSVILSYAESFDGLFENAWDSDVRAALSYDVGQDLKVPLGLALTAGYFGNNVDSSTESGVWFWSLRVATQSRPDFVVGFEYVSSYSQSSSSRSDESLGQLNFDLRYYY